MTGCTGFIGKWLVEALLCANDLMGLNCRLHLLTRSPQNFLQAMPHIAGRADLAIVAGSLLDTPESSFPAMDYVIHGANLGCSANTPMGGRPLPSGHAGHRTAVPPGGLQRLPWALLLSSGAVYGTQALGWRRPLRKNRKL